MFLGSGSSVQDPGSRVQSPGPGYRSSPIKGRERRWFPWGVRSCFSIYCKDFDVNWFQVQQEALSAYCKELDTILVCMIAEVLKNLKIRSLLTEIIKLAKLILVMPATNSTSERSFSFLELIKTYTKKKVSVFGVALVRIFPHSDWIPSDTEYSTLMRENTDQSNSKYGHLSAVLLAINNESINLT